MYKNKIKDIGDSKFLCIFANVIGNASQYFDILKALRFIFGSSESRHF